MAEEVELLPEGSAIVEMLGDYAVMREQARACVTIHPNRRSMASRVFPMVLQL